VSVVTAKTRFNCEEAWGRPGNDIATALGHLHEALENEPSPVPRTEAVFASAH
jgi:hypothetical protein